MAGASLPYHLRPHKAVDRRIFLDLLRRFERWRPLGDYAYLSMGAYPLEDHKLVHRALGITRLIAFDLDAGVVARQLFNRPIQTCSCLHKSAGETIDELHRILKDAGCTNDTGVIVWLDYTDPKQIGAQLREFQTLLDRLRVGDVVRVTVNAHPSELSEPEDRPGRGERPPTVEARQAKQFKRLQERIGEFLPSTTKPESLTMDGLPTVLAASFAAAALKALPVSGNTTFRPLSITRYRDGQQMLSITGAVVARGEEAQVAGRLGLEAWPFASETWTRIHNLVVPDLTVRERLFLEREVTSSSVGDIVKALGFGKAGDIEVADFLENYRHYYRFYPTLLATDL